MDCLLESGGFILGKQKGSLKKSLFWHIIMKNNLEAGKAWIKNLNIWNLYRAL